MTAALEPSLATAADLHHEELREELVRLSQALIDAVDDQIPFEPARRRLAEFLRARLRPHLDAEEVLLYATAESGPTMLLARGMQDEHRVLTALVQEIERATRPMDAAIAAGALVVVFDLRVRLEGRHLLPALAATGVDLAFLLEDTPEIVGATTGSRS
jgi:hypothetical protein